MNRKIRKQKGVVLILCLVLLVILTLFVVSYGRISVLSWRSSKNYSERLSMMVRAEKALLEAETNINNQANLSSLPSYYYPNPSVTTLDPFNSSTWGTTSSSNPSVQTASDGCTQYYIEVIQTIAASGSSTTGASVDEGGYGEDTSASSSNLTVFRTVVHAEDDASCNADSSTAQSGPNSGGVLMIESFYERGF